MSSWWNVCRVLGMVHCSKPPPFAKGVGVQHCSVRWSMLIEHASNQLLQMLLLISHNANLHVACGYIGFWVCWINHHVCCMDTHMCVYGFVSDTSVYACMHGCQEWGAEFSLHVNWSMLFAVYLCLSGSCIRGVCFFQVWGVTYWLIQAVWVQVMQKVHTPTHMYAFECICVCSLQCGVM